jgi:monoamine oxidase
VFKQNASLPQPRLIFSRAKSDELSERQNVHVGNLVFAGEQLSDEYYGFMNGAAQTGRLAAQVILRREGFSKVLKF